MTQKKGYCSVNRVRLIFSSLTLALLMALTSSNDAFAKQQFREVNWETLELSDTQRSSLNRLDQQWKSSVNDLVPRIKANENKLQTLMKSSKPDEREIIRLQEQIHEDKMKLKLEATHIFLTKRKILNKDQQVKLQRMINYAD